MTALNWPEILKSHAIFADLTDEQVTALRDVAQDASYAQDQDVVAQGDTGDEVFIIGSGTAYVTVKRPGADPILLKLLQCGDFFGEIAAIGKCPRSATVTAREPLQVLKMPGSAFRDVLKINPSLEARILVKVAEEVRSLTSIAIQARVDDVSERFEEVNRKMDYELKAIDAQLKAAHSLYDNTKLRTDEIINTAERSRAMLNMVVGAAVAIAGLLGFSTFQNVTKVTENVAKVEKVLEEVEDLQEDVQLRADQAGEAADQLEQVQNRIDQSRFDLATAMLEVYQRGFRAALASVDLRPGTYYEPAREYVRESYEEFDKDPLKGFANAIIYHILEIADSDGTSPQREEMARGLSDVLETMWSDAVLVKDTEVANQAAILWTYLEWPPEETEKPDGTNESNEPNPLDYLLSMNPADRVSAFAALPAFPDGLGQTDEAKRFNEMKEHLKAP